MFSAYTDKAYHWFHSGPSNHWYRSYGVGLSLRIPIFDGLDKRYKMRKATIDIENIKLAQENTRKNLQTQYLNATNDLMNSQRNFKKQKDNYLLAEDVYTVTMERYREGIASMTEVLQDEMQMSEAQNNYITLLIYTESDIEYSFSPYDSLSGVAVGTKEEVLSRLAGTKFSLYSTVCGYVRSIGYFYFEDLILAPNEDVDFSKPGYVSLKAAYKGIVDTLYIELVPQTEGVTKITYQIGSDTLELYENGIAYYKNSWGTYSLINEDLNIYQLTFYGYRNPIFFTTKDNAATIFRAEMLADNPEVYSMFNAEGLCSVKVYTKNGFSLADIYDKDGRYEQTVRVTFSSDGKHAYVLNVKYTIKDGNVLEIVPEGNVVYRYYEENGENEYIRGTLNDNGTFYLYMVQTDDSGAVTAEHLIFAYIWIEKDGVITVYENETALIKGKIIDGYLVIDY